ncbi:MAG: cell division protein FtsW [Lachnospiraceae bacterium]|nr:cell division protein FtsW [Lachnospiraceae bacterium]
MVDVAKKHGTRKRIDSKGYFDFSLLIIIIFLVCFGMIMLYSTVSYTAQIQNITTTSYLRNQIWATVLGFFCMFLFAKMDYHFLKKVAVLAYIGSLALIVLVLTPLGITRNGATRWIGVGSFLTFQPAEVVKVGVIIFAAHVMDIFSRKKKAEILSLIALAFAIIPAIMLWKITDNLSSAIIVAGIAVIIIFVSTKAYKVFIAAGIAVAAVVAFVIIKLDWLLSVVASFRFERIQAWLSPEEFAQGTGYQTLQSLYAIGSGSFFGKGLGNSVQKLNFLPEPQNDMIFAIICEELGLFGAICVILMFLFMIWRFMVIANNAPDMFGALLVTGIMAHIAIQVILNIAVVTNTIPNTGITLPFISYGGTSVVFLLAEMGIALGVSRQIKVYR